MGNEHQKKAVTICFSFSLLDYLTLVAATGRILRDEKPGVINPKTANILTRLHISDKSCLRLTTNFERIFTGAAGTAGHLSEFSKSVGLKRTHGVATAQAYLNSA
jgi:hypothetical protein